MTAILFLNLGYDNVAIAAFCADAVDMSKKSLNHFLTLSKRASDRGLQYFNFLFWKTCNFFVMREGKEEQFCNIHYFPFVEYREL